MHGTVRSQGALLVAGRVDGNVIAKNRIELLPTAVVRGTLCAPVIKIRPGAIVEGRLSMASAEETEFADQAA